MSFNEIMMVLASISCGIFIMYGLALGHDAPYKAWKNTKTDVYLEIFGHKEMTESTKLKILNAKMRN